MGSHEHNVQNKEVKENKVRQKEELRLRGGPEEPCQHNAGRRKQKWLSLTMIAIADLEL